MVSPKNEILTLTKAYRRDYVSIGKAYYCKFPDTREDRTAEVEVVDIATPNWSNIHYASAVLKFKKTVFNGVKVTRLVRSRTSQLQIDAVNLVGKLTAGVVHEYNKTIIDSDYALGEGLRPDESIPYYMYWRGGLSPVEVFGAMKTSYGSDHLIPPGNAEYMHFTVYKVTHIIARMLDLIYKLFKYYKGMREMGHMPATETMILDALLSFLNVTIASRTGVLVAKVGAKKINKAEDSITSLGSYNADQLDIYDFKSYIYELIESYQSQHVPFDEMVCVAGVLDMNKFLFVLTSRVVGVISDLNMDVSGRPYLGEVGPYTDIVRKRYSHLIGTGIQKSRLEDRPDSLSCNLRDYGVYVRYNHTIADMSIQGFGDGLSYLPLISADMLDLDMPENKESEDDYIRTYLYGRAGFNFKAEKFRQVDVRYARSYNISRFAYGASHIEACLMTNNIEDWAKYNKLPDELKEALRDPNCNYVLIAHHMAGAGTSYRDTRDDKAGLHFQSRNMMGDQIVIPIYCTKSINDGCIPPLKGEISCRFDIDMHTSPYIRESDYVALMSKEEAHIYNSLRQQAVAGKVNFEVFILTGTQYRVLAELYSNVSDKKLPLYMHHHVARFLINIAETSNNSKLNKYI